MLAWEHTTIETCDHQRSMLTYEHPIKKVSKQMRIKAYKKVNKLSSKHVDIEAYNYQSMGA